LNGKEDEIKPGGRLSTCIAEMKRLRKETVEDKNPGEPKVCFLLFPLELVLMSV